MREIGVFCFNDAVAEADAEAETEAGVDTVAETVANEDAVRFVGLGGGMGNGG